MAVDPRILALYSELRADYPLFAREVLRIRTKKGGPLYPLIFNSAQELLHENIEKQKSETGKVRMLVPKSRQVGTSTYVGGRYYHNTSNNEGRNTFIMAHEKAASDTLFGMVDLFHENNPFAPFVGRSNIRELEFKKIRSTYTVATAGAEASGRSKALSNYHGSEVAFWPSAEEHFSASIQAVPDEEDTEIVLESTANGVTGEFYERVQDAIQGRGDYSYTFIPWFMMREYTRSAEGFEPSDVRKENELFTEREYMEHFDLTPEHMAWRRHKIDTDLKTVMRFDREYPGSVELAFQQKMEGSYHDAGNVMRARKRSVLPNTQGGPLIIGADPAGEGGDRFSIAFRRGFVCEGIQWRDNIDHVEAVAWLVSIIDEHNPAVVFIDAGGIGKPVIASLRAMGSRYNIPHVRGVNFGAKSQHLNAKPRVPGPQNRRAEMQMRLKEWLAAEEGAVIPDMDALQADFMNIKIKPSFNNNLLLEDKHAARRDGRRSPDLADALGLTFADAVYVTDAAQIAQPARVVQSGRAHAIARPTGAEIRKYGIRGPGSWML